MAITAQPKAASGAVGDTVKFTVQAKGEGLTYQWQYYTGSKWANSSMTGSKTAALSVSVTAGRNGQKYRCVVTDASGVTATSDAAALTVKIAITKQPQNAAGTVGSRVMFEVQATGADLRYHWQYKAPGSDKWVASSAGGVYSNCIWVDVTAWRNGQKYRCVVTDANGKQYTSDAARLTVNTKITTQPANKTVSAGTTAKFTVKATGAGLTYQWQYYTGSKWVNSGMTGSQTATLEVPATTARNGQQYRCVITDANGSKTTTKTVTLTVK